MKIINLQENFCNYYKKLEEEFLVEGTDYRKQAIKILQDSNFFSEEEAAKAIDNIKSSIHAFNHAPAWLEKYLKGIARLIVKDDDYVSSSSDNNTINDYLTWVIENRDKLNEQEKKNLDDNFINKMTLKDIEDFVNKVKSEREEQSKNELANMEFSNSNYSLVPIYSYEDFNNRYGGRLTGDGSSDKYAGGGGTAWCHTNNRSVYKDWVRSNKRFYVLQNNDFENILFNKDTNEKMVGKDEYGNSLIAILVDKNGNLENATLRCNHVGVPSSADNQYKTYAELSKIAGFNVEEEIKKDIEENPIGYSEYDGGDERLISLAEYLGIDPSEIVVFEYNTEYTTPDGTYLVLDEDEADEEFRRDIEMLWDELGLGGFTKEMRERVIDIAGDEDKAEQYVRDYYSSYVQDGMDEDDIIEMAIDNALIYPDDVYDEDGNFIEDSVDIDNLRDELIDYYVENEDYFQFLIDYLSLEEIENCLDYDRVIDFLMEESDRGNRIASYDGEEIDLGNGYYAYRIE